MIDELTDSNFTLYAAQHYTNINCVSFEEFIDDLNRIKYIKKLFRKHEKERELKTQLILNHIIILYNVFDRDACTKLLCFRLPEYLHFLKPFLILLNTWPEKIVINKTIDGTLVPLDQDIIDSLRNIVCQAQ